MVKNFFLPKLRNNAVVEKCYFQQDGSLAHYAWQIRDYLNQLFPDMWIGSCGSLEVYRHFITRQLTTQHLITIGLGTRHLITLGLG